MSVLDEILANKRLEVAAARAAVPLAEVRAAVEPMPWARDFGQALRAPGLSVIAEIKRASPAKGELNVTMDASTQARRYADAGATAISVLTDQKYFRGDPRDLAAVRATTDVPLLRKEFIVDEYQIWEARALGADAILLIVAALADAEIVYFQDLAAELGMAALVEVHDAAELDRAMACGARIVGVNNRNLKTLAVDLATTEALAPSIPRDVVKVGESGIRSISDVGRMVAAGIDAILVGEALVVADDPGALIRAWRHLPAHAEVR